MFVNDGGREIEMRDEHPSNVLYPMPVNNGGISIDRSDEHCLKERFPILFNDKNNFQ